MQMQTQMQVQPEEEEEEDEKTGRRSSGKAGKSRKRETFERLVRQLDGYGTYV
jgi:hypothetical protein